MKLFQQLLLAPAALGLLAPIAAQAADVSSLSGASAASAYSAQQDTDAFRAWQSQNQVTSVAQFSDVQPTDWAYQALSNLVERYGCVAGYPNGTFKGKQAMTRFEAAALLNACLDRVTEVTDELRRLQKEFAKELAVLKGRVSSLEAKVGKLEATQFSTTTKLVGETTWALGAQAFGGNNNGTSGTNGTNGTNANSQRAGATTFNYDLRLALNTSFTGKDLLFTRLRTGNFVNSGFNGTPYTLSRLDIAFPGSTQGTSAQNNIFFIDRLFYRFPVGKEFTFAVGPLLRNTETLAIEPSYYGDLKLLDAFTVHGAPGTYNKATGGGAAVIWRQNVKKGAPFFGASLSYIAQNANSATSGTGSTNGANAGGIMGNNSQSNLLLQLGYQAQQWKSTFAWRWGSCGTNAREGTQAAIAAAACPGATSSGTQPSAGWGGNNVDVNNFAYTLAWTPKKNGTIVPSISAGWGYSAYNAGSQLGAIASSVGTSSTSGISDQLAVNNIAATQSWTVALQWKDAFIKGNSAGMAVGQPNFVTALRNGQTAQDGNYVWEWWYKFQVTDKISVSPALYYLSNPSSSGTVGGQSASTGANVFGGLVMAQFKF